MTGYDGTFPAFQIPFKKEEPCFRRGRLRSELEKKIIKQKLEELIEDGYAEVAPPHCQFGSETVLAAKKDEMGDWLDVRWCGDYRAINDRSEKRHYRTQLPDELFKRFDHSEFMSKIDLKAGYYQCQMTEDAKNKTAFWAGGRLYRYTRMPFGPTGAPSYFQELMDFTFQSFEFVEAYLDDLLIFSKDAEEHIQHIGMVLDRLIEVNLKIHPSKSVFAAQSVEYLGYELQPGRLTPHEAKTKAIRELKTPTTVSELRAVYGLLSYYRCFDPLFAQIENPLHALMGGGGPTNFKAAWTTDCDIAYQKLKDNLCRDGLAVRNPDITKEYILHTDWSKFGIGAVLAQKDDNGHEYMIACISRSLNKHERNYPSFEGEMLAVVWAIKSFRHYLEGEHFKVITDHAPLTYLRN